MSKGVINMAKIYSGQKSYLLGLLLKVFTNISSEELWDFTGLITEKQYKLFVALYFQDKEKLKKAVWSSFILKNLNYGNSNKESGAL